MPSELSRWVREILAGAAGGVLAGKVEHGNPAVSDSERATLFLDLQGLPQDAAAALWRRHREAVTQLRENHFVRALARIPADRRKDALIQLAQIADEDFQQALTLLDPERGRIREALERELQPIAEAMEADRPRLQERIAELKASIKEEHLRHEEWKRQREKKRSLLVRFLANDPIELPLLPIKVSLMRILLVLAAGALALAVLGPPLPR